MSEKENVTGELARLSDSKDITLDIARRLRGDDFTISVSQKLETGYKLLCDENKIVSKKDMKILDSNLSTIVKKIHDMSESLYKYSELLSLLQIKYTPENENSKKNIPNINASIERFSNE